MAGRHTLCTPERVERLVQLVQAGNYIETACAVEGISEHTFYLWGRNARDAMEREDLDLGNIEEMVNGTDDWPEGITENEKQYLGFLYAMNKATATSEAYAVATIRKAMPNNPVAAMMWLERRFPARWRKRSQIDVGQGEDSASQERERAMLQSQAAVEALHEALQLEASADGALVDAQVVDDTEPTV